MSGNKEAVKLLLLKGADLHAEAMGKQTAIHWAAHHSEPDVLDLLLSKGAHVNAKNLFGQKPVHIACIYGHNKILKRLLEMKADVSSQDLLGGTPLHYAAAGGDIPTIDILLGANADINATGKSVLAGVVNLTMADVLNGFFSSLSNGKMDQTYENTPSEFEGITPLHWAAGNGNIQALKHLVEKGAKATTIDSFSNTSLHWAANQKMYFGSSSDSQEQKPVANTEARNYAASIKYLVAKGVGVDSKNQLGRTPLHLAAASGCKDAIIALVKSGANINAIDDTGRTPLHLAVSEATHDKKTDVVKLLLEWGADTKIKEKKHGWTPADFAETFGYQELADLIRKRD
jgi:cytohesin